jgi:hypothetical protein
MNIFIAFGYNENDKWIKELVFPLVEAFDGDVLTGEDLHGSVISQEVINRIKNADGVLAFLTRRDQLASGRYTSHSWVQDELITAINNNIPAVGIKDNLVDTQTGLAGDRQRIDFDLDDKGRLMVELAKLLATWRRNMKPRRFFLLPKDIVQDARPFINAGNLKCYYQFMNGSKASPKYETKPFRYGQGLCVDIYNVPAEEALVQVCVEGPAFSWSSDYESVQLLSINLQKD